MIRIVDLSFDIYDRAPTFYADPKTAVIEHLKIENLNYNITQLVMSTHLGTHLDAPFHFFDDGRTVDNLDVRKGFGPAWVLDFTRKKPGEGITLEDMKRHADKVRRGSRLIFYTGWDKVYPKKEYFGGQPYLSVEASTWLAEQGVWCVALDCPTTYPAEYTPSHHSLLNKKAEVLIIEGLRGLERLRGPRVILMALPLRVRGRDGSPCRAMALDGDIEPLVEVFEKLEYNPEY